VRPPGSAVGPLEGRDIFSMRGVFILNEIWVQEFFLLDSLLVSNMTRSLFCNLNLTKLCIKLENYVIH
jgi:hypothetical protein